MAPPTVVDEMLEGPPKEAAKMRSTTKFRVTALVFAIVGFLLAPQTPLGAAIWGAPALEGPPPTGAQMGLLMGVGVVQSIGFGLGIAVLAYGLPGFRRVFGERARWAHLAVVWGLASWVPHGAMHMTTGHDVGKLVLTEYVFHVTLVLAGAALAFAVWQAAQAPTASGAPAAAPRATASVSVVRRAP